MTQHWDHRPPRLMTHSDRPVTINTPVTLEACHPVPANWKNWAGIAKPQLDHQVAVVSAQPSNYQRVSTRHLWKYDLRSAAFARWEINVLYSWLKMTCCHGEPGMLRSTCFSLQPGGSILVFYIDRLYQKLPSCSHHLCLSALGNIALN